MSPTCGVRELRSKLPEAIRRASGGERTVITSAGRPVAQLAPLDADAPDLLRLIGAGAVIPPRRAGCESCAANCPKRSAVRTPVSAR